MVQENGWNSGDVLTVLVWQGYLTAEQADSIRRQARGRLRETADAVRQAGHASEEAVTIAFSVSHDLPLRILAREPVPVDVVEQIPAKVLVHYQMVPLQLEGRSLTAAFGLPPSAKDIDSLRMLTAFRVVPVLATPAEIRAVLERICGRGDPPGAATVVVRK